MNTTRSYSMSARAGAVAATRERIARAAMQLFFEQAYEDVTLVAIAKAAGVSHQTVLNHFESKEGVALAAGEIIQAETTSARRVKPGDVKSAVRAAVDEYERFGDANFRWAASSERLGKVAKLLDIGRTAHRQWIETCFDAHLPRTPAARRRAVTAIYAATDVYTWKLLRRDLHMSRTETESVMVDIVSAVLARTEESR